MRTAVQYGVPAAVSAAAWLALVAGVIAAVRWTRKRKARPGYAPLWVLAYVLAIVAVATVCGVFAVVLEGRRQGRHRQRPAVGRREARSCR